MYTLLSKSSLPSVSVKSSTLFAGLKHDPDFWAVIFWSLTSEPSNNLSGADCAGVCVNKLSVQETIFKSGLSMRLTECGGEILCTGVLITFCWIHMDCDSFCLPLSTLLLTQSDNGVHSLCHVLSLSWLSIQSDSWDDIEFSDDEKLWTSSVSLVTFFWEKCLLKDGLRCKLFSDSSISLEVDESSFDKFTVPSLKIKL